MSLVVAVVYVFWAAALMWLCGFSLSRSHTSCLSLLPILCMNSVVPLVCGVAAIVGLRQYREGREIGRGLHWSFGCIAFATAALFLFSYVRHIGVYFGLVLEWETLGFGLSTGLAVWALWFIHRRVASRSKWLVLLLAALSLLAAGLGTGLLQQTGFLSLVMGSGPALALAVLWWRRARRVASEANETDGTQGTNG